jgi:hypothetical protein
VKTLTIECSHEQAARRDSASGPSSTPVCLRVTYVGPPNELDNTVSVPRTLPSDAISRGAFGQWTLRASGLPPGDYLLPSFDYSFLRAFDAAGAAVPLYQFDRRSVIRLDGHSPTYSVSYDLSEEVRILWAWVCLLLIGAAGLWAARHRFHVRLGLDATRPQVVVRPGSTGMH